MTKDEVAWELFKVYMVRNIGWPPENCAIRAKETLKCVKANFPSILPEELGAEPPVSPPKVSSPMSPPVTSPQKEVRSVGRPRRN